MENDDARRGNAFAVGGLAYKMSKAALNMRESIYLNCHIVCSRLAYASCIHMTPCRLWALQVGLAGICEDSPS